jgi:sugar phosphate isomerase/epimerase
MMISVNTYTMGFAGDLEAKLAKTAEIGFEGIEFQPDNFDVSGEIGSVGADAEKIRAICAKHGLKPCTVACDADFVQPDKNEFDRWVRWGEYCGALSARLGLEVVKYFAGEPKEGLTDGQIVDFMINGSKELAAIGEKYDVAFAEENHGSFTNRPEVQRRIVDAVGSPRVGVCIDSSNYRWYGHSLEKVHRIFREMAPYTLHVHAKDGDGSAGAMGDYKATALGEGEIDIALMLRQLADNNYAGDLVIEYEGPEGEAGVRRSLAYLQGLRDGIFGA